MTALLIFALLSPCALSKADQGFFQSMLDDWATITGELFRRPSHRRCGGIRK